MKRILLFSFLIFNCIVIFAINLNVSVTLSGTIKNNRNEAIVGATIYITDLKIGTVTDGNGFYQINNLPASRLLIQVSSLGFKTIAEIIPLNSDTYKNFILQETIIEINEIAVTGQANAIKLTKTPSPISVIGHTTLLQSTSTNIIDAISQQPGISQITTGSGISKPVIRGLGYNRLIVMNNGVRQEGQQWGDEHGIEIDENDVNKVEILKGPASLLYGSDAMAGVINFLPDPVLPEDTREFNLIGNYQTNNGLYAFSGNFAGHKNAFIWNIRYSNKAAHDYKNRYDGYVFNSGFAENAASAFVGIHKSWGYSHLTLSTYNITPGLVEGERDSSSGQFIKHVLLDNNLIEQIVGSTDFLNYKTNIPYQKINHNKAALNTNIVIGNGMLKSTFGFQQNQRLEFTNVLSPKEAGLYFKENSFTYDIHYQIPEMKLWKSTIGINGMLQQSFNLGREFLIPEFRLFDAGSFFMFSRQFSKFNLSGGFRFDNRYLVANALFLNNEHEITTSEDRNASEKFSAMNKNFTGISWSLGAAWEVNKNWNLKINLSKGYRAPNISELSSNGIHEGTFRFETGNKNLKSESSFQLDYELAFNNEHVSAHLNLFSNMINNFIYSRKLNGAINIDSISEGVPVFQFQQDQVILYGGEFTLDIHPHPLDWLHFENSFSYVNSQFIYYTDLTKHLPFTPAPKWSSTLKAELDLNSENCENTYLSIGYDYNFAQNHIYSAYTTETVTPAYGLLNISAGTDIILKHQKISIFLTGQNITDLTYQSHLSRLKYAPVNYATGRIGVFNRGRNISLKVVVPIKL